MRAERRPRGLTGPLATAVLAVLVSGFVVVFVVGLAAWGDRSFLYYTVDPAATEGEWPLVGFLSWLGGLIAFGAGSVALFAGALIAWNLGWRRAAVVAIAGAGTAYIAFDDTFRLHDELFQDVGIDQEVAYAVYAVCAVAFLWIARETLRLNEWPLLALACVLLAGSVALDQRVVDFGAPYHRWIEDGVKLFGTAFLALYLVRLSARMFTAAYRGEPSGRVSHLRTRLAGLLSVKGSVLLVAALSALALAVVAVLAGATDYSFAYFTKDPASTLSASPLIGLMSNVGVIFAWSAASIGAFGALLVVDARGWRPALPLLLMSAGVAYFALDDLLMLHEGIYEDELGWPETGVVAVYALATLAFLVRFRDFLRAHEWPLLVAALSLLAYSFALDFDDSASFRLAPTGFEDSAKLFGIALLAGYVIRVSGRMLFEAYGGAATYEVESRPRSLDTALV